MKLYKTLLKGKVRRRVRLCPICGNWKTLIAFITSHNDACDGCNNQYEEKTQ